MKEVTLPVLKCLRCNHESLPRTGRLPGYCPKCKSPSWDKERARKIVEVKKEGVVVSDR
jgi:hypothetical protein